MLSTGVFGGWKMSIQNDLDDYQMNFQATCMWGCNLIEVFGNEAALGTASDCTAN